MFLHLGASLCDSVKYMDLQEMQEQFSVSGQKTGSILFFSEEVLSPSIVVYPNIT